jgi:hypothetical protein
MSDDEMMGGYGYDDYDEDEGCSLSSFRAQGPVRAAAYRQTANTDI